MSSSFSHKSFTVSCVVDQQPRFYTELILWAECAARYLPSSYKKIVYFVDHGVPDLLGWLDGRGFETRISTKLVPANPHCNKIAPFLDRCESDYTLVCDVDLFFVADPSPLFRSNRVRAAPNNHCNPPLEIFQSIFHAAGILDWPIRPGISLFPGHMGQRETHINNLSAGIVGIPAPRRVELAKAWLHWGRWLAERANILGPWSMHVDQVALCLAMEHLGEDIEFLPPQVNCVLELLPQVATVYAFHLTSAHIPQYPHMFSSDKTLRTSEFSEGLTKSILALNDCILRAAEVIKELPSTRDHMVTFLNPEWKR
jgi:hypothetical protein